MKHLEEVTKRRNQVTANISESMDKNFAKLHAKQQDLMAQRMKVFEARLNSIQPDEERIRAKALSSMIDTFEGTLSQGKAAAPGSASKVNASKNGEGSSGR